MRFFSILLGLILAVPGAQVFAEPNVYLRSNGQFVHKQNEYARKFWVPAVQGAEEVFASNAEAAALYQAHLHHAKWFSILNWGALGAYLIYAGVTLPGDNYQGGVGLAVFFVPWIFGIGQAAKSERALLKAMNIINGVPPAQANFGLPPSRGVVSANTLQVPVFTYSF